MMRPSIVLCTSSFWPDADEAAWWATDFCKALEKRNLSALVFAPRTVKSNPSQFSFHGSTVHRIFHSQWPQLGQYQYWRKVLETVRQYGIPEVGFVVSDSPPQTIGAIQTARKFKSVSVVRMDGRWTNDTVNLKTIRRMKSLEQSARHQFQGVSSNLSSIEIVAGRFGLQKRPMQVADGVLKGESFFSGDHEKSALRKHLGATHSMLSVDAAEPLVVCMDSFQDHLGMIHVVRAWRKIRERWPQARLWISSPNSPAFARNSRQVWDEILRNELNNEVIMPGLFDVREDLMFAADLLICTHPVNPANQRMIKRAMSCKLPVLTVDHPCLRDLMVSGQTGWSFAAEDRGSMLKTLIKLLGDPATTQSVVDEAKLWIAMHHDFDATVDRYLQILDSI